MQFLCEFFKGDAFNPFSFYSTFAIYVLPFQLQRLLSVCCAGSSLAAVGKVLGLGLGGGRYARLSLCSFWTVRQSA